MSQLNSRRQFVKLALGVSGIALLAPKAVLGAEGRRAAPAAGGGGSSALPLVKPGEGMAASVKYVHNNADVKDAALKVDRQGVPFAKQQCVGCMLYTPDGKQDGADVGKCTLFNGMHVKSTGWCTSWSKKA